MPPHLDRVVVTCAFDENAITALTRWLDREGVLHTRYVPRRYDKAVQRVLGLMPVKPATLQRYERRLAARQQRRFLAADRPTSALSEPLRILGGRMRTPLSHQLGNYVWKAVFDRVTAAQVLPGAEMILGLPGSSLDTFKRAAAELTVFHAIDCHPRFRNDVLDHHYGRRKAVAEMYPERLVQRIEDELTISDRVLVPSDLVGRQMTDHGVPAEKIVNVPYGVDTSQFRYCPAEASRGAGIGRSRPRVIYVGQVSLSKGLPFLIEAVRGLPLDLSIIGNVFDHRIVRSLPDNVEWVGGLAPEALARRYWEATAMVLPTLQDSYGLVVLEALAAGLPVVTTSSAGAAQLLDSRHAIVEPGSTGELRSALRSLVRLSDDERLAISGSIDTIALPDGRRMDCDWDSYATEVMATLGEALAQQRTRP